MTRGLHMTEETAKAAFDEQAPVFDQLYSSDTIIQYKRDRVRRVADAHIAPYSRILELNAGTGEDAIYFASRGHAVHATDISEGMLAELAAKSSEAGLDALISHEQCSYTQLENLRDQGQYDFVFSNFAGLNCTPRLDKVLDSLVHLVRPGGYVTLVILPKFCLWEFLLLLKGKFRTAFRRFSGKRGANAHIEGKHFRCWYYNPSFVRRRLAASFNVVGLEGLCTLVPPSYLLGFAEKHPKIYSLLMKQEERRRKSWPWRTIGDYYIITLKRKL